MKKRPTKKTSKQYDFNKVVKVLFLILLVLFIAAQIVVDRHLLTRTSQMGDSRIQDLIIEGIRGVRKDAVVDGPSGKVYMPDAKLVLPAYPQDIKGILYSYENLGESANDYQILLTSQEALGYGIAKINSATSFEGTFNAVPTAQKCSRQIVMAFNPNSELASSEEYRQVHNMLLADGRHVLMYLDKGCEESAGSIIAYLKQIQSY